MRSGRARPSWLAFLERQLDRIGGDVEALIWAIGCVWALRVERLIGKAQPPVNCALFFAGLYLTINYLLTHLAWYGLPRHQVEFPVDSLRGILKFAIFTGLVVLVGLVAPGRPRRRVFAGSAFPFLALLGLLASAVGTEVANSISLPYENHAVEAILRGLAYGLIAAPSMSLPAVLLYRATAAPVAVLALVPAIAKAVAARPQVSVYTFGSFFWPVWPFICSLIIVTIFTCVFYRWLCRPLDIGHPPAR